MSDLPSDITILSMDNKQTPQASSGSEEKVDEIEKIIERLSPLQCDCGGEHTEACVAFGKLYDYIHHLQSENEPLLKGNLSMSQRAYDSLEKAHRKTLDDLDSVRADYVALRSALKTAVVELNSLRNGGCGRERNQNFIGQNYRDNCLCCKTVQENIDEALSSIDPKLLE